MNPTIGAPRAGEHAGPAEAELEAQAGIVPARGLSYVRGTRDAPLSDATLADLLRDTATRYPERAALVFREQGIRWRWRDFAAEVDALAAGFDALGIVKGERVGIWSPNRAEWLLTLFAAARIGAIVVNLNPAYQLSEIEYALNKVRCRVLVTAERFKSSDYIAMLGTLAPELASSTPGALRSARLPALEIVIRLGAPGIAPVTAPATAAVAGMLHFDDVLAHGRATLDTARLDALSAALAADEPINLQYTSGTTGNPKGTMLTHRNIVNNGRFIAQAMHFTEHDRLCLPVPLFHCFGMVLGVLACVAMGAAAVFPGEAFEPAATLAAVAGERCTALHGVPTMFIAELEHPDFARYDLSSLRTGIMAGSPCPIETMKRVVAQMHMTEVTIAYGMTETSPVSFQSAATDPLEKRTTTVGRVQPHLEVKIVAPDGSLVPVGETGELCTRGYSVMLGYWDEPAATEATIHDGWMHTGDLATLDADGYCTIVGRLKDMLIRGGENIFPREIEEFLFRHPKIRIVQVFGVPDPKYGEAVCAWIIPNEGVTLDEDEIRAFCQGQIAHYKIPKYIRFVDQMPMTGTGKVQKFMMRKQMIEMLREEAGEAGPAGEAGRGGGGA